ncbi:NADH-quinone oxidoreductase subunit A [Actinomadura sp. 3N508]|uniref:NADH-quinone oxidoreductase subunit A n=1 Tax=Actinomadura sp. 3N508 TaxID=3375153 RepID=UPI0037B46295
MDALSFVYAPPGAPGTGPFLSGARPQEHAVSCFHVRWYVVTTVFLAFDMEMVFRYPWAVVVASVGTKAVVEMFAFLALLVVGVVYAWREGAFRWARLFRFAHAHPRAFVVTAPGATRTRLFVEVELRRRGGCPVPSPAAASMLVVCGRPGADLTAAVDAVWEDVPGPRSLVRLDESASAEEVPAELDRATQELADVPAQWADAVARKDRGPWSPADESGGMGEHDDHMSSHEHHHAALSEYDHGDGPDEMHHGDGHAGHEAGHGQADDSDHDGHEEGPSAEEGDHALEPLPWFGFELLQGAVAGNGEQARHDHQRGEADPVSQAETTALGRAIGVEEVGAVVVEELARVSVDLEPDGHVDDAENGRPCPRVPCQRG